MTKTRWRRREENLWEERWAGKGWGISVGWVEEKKKEEKEKKGR